MSRRKKKPLRYMNFETWFSILEDQCKKADIPSPGREDALLAWRGGWRVGQFVKELREHPTKP